MIEFWTLSKQLLKPAKTGIIASNYKLQRISMNLCIIIKGLKKYKLVILSDRRLSDI